MANASRFFTPSVPSLRRRIQPPKGIFRSGSRSPEGFSTRVFCSSTAEGADKLASGASSSESRVPRLNKSVLESMFYAFDKGTIVPQFLNYFKTQSSNYNGGKVLVSFSTDASSGGLKPENGFFTACGKLKSQKQLHGGFLWSADDSKANGFRYEKEAGFVILSIVEL
ncbi:hypothetical protein SO802_014994 [Lithocarpus litseifolius]|uniref:Uncharacterized protein n=1 Tax=Lithocarpus litseifolius TaxID=425828 RepID=A0AAW2CUL0_9ROSI